MRFKIIGGGHNEGRILHGTHAQDVVSQRRNGKCEIRGFTHRGQESDWVLTWPLEAAPIDAEAIAAIDAIDKKRAQLWANRFVESERQRKEELVWERSERQRKAREKLRLEAAAPMLLEALQGMCSVWVTVCNSKGWDPEHMSQYVKARTAISSATTDEEQESEGEAA